jgi:hypothetical protein
MKKGAEIYSKGMFWLENLVYIVLFLVYELSLVPIIYFKMFFNLIRSTGVFSFIPLALTWVLIGPIVLVFYGLKDTFYFVKTLCDYGTDEDLIKEKEKEDEKASEEIIFNEVLAVINSLYSIAKFDYKEREAE